MTRRDEERTLTEEADPDSTTLSIDQHGPRRYLVAALMMYLCTAPWWPWAEARHGRGRAEIPAALREVVRRDGRPDRTS